MSGRLIKHHYYTPRKVAYLLIILGMLFIAAGTMIFLLNTGSESESELQEDVENTVEVSQTLQDETVSTTETIESSTSSESKTEETSPSEETAEVITENPLTEEVPIKFAGVYLDVAGYSFVMADGTTPLERDVPSFHTVSAISAEAGVNPKTNDESDTLLVIMSAIPDREMSISVVVSTDELELTGTNPDDIHGLQWTLTYSDGEFKKTARSVTADGLITQLSAEDFNVRYIGNEDTAEVEFFGLPGTYYYAVMIYDDSYFTLVLPDTD